MPFRHLQVQHHLRAMRLMALVLAFAVTALFSMVPFKVPRVFFFPPTLSLEQTTPSDHAIQAVPRVAQYLDSTALEPVHGLKSIDLPWVALLPLVPLFAGVRTLAGLSVWKARRIALPPPIHIRLRAPPALG
ncbi:MAG TPA: hypothetical protein V6D05_12700 [Stenomitos sp.]